jgi:hypothetical protein
LVWGETKPKTNRKPNLQLQGGVHTPGIFESIITFRRPATTTTAVNLLPLAT